MNAKIKSLVRAILPRAVHPHRILAGPLRGFRIVTSWYDYPAALLGYTERKLLTWFSENVKPGQTWLDIGAHYGYTAIALSRLVGPRGRVYAFEPLVSTAGCVSQSRLLNSIPQLTVLPLALGEKDGFEVRQLPIERGMVDSTIEGGTWKEAILVTGLDWLWPQVCGGSPQIDGVKIDVQGMEIEVLRGMSRLLRAHRPKLVVEIHRGVDRSQLLDAIENAGYSRCATLIEPVPGEVDPQYVDNNSYEFHPLQDV